MIADRYYYNRLSAEEKECYAALYKGITALEKEICLPMRVAQDTVQRIFDAVTHDNPHLYYFNQTRMDFKTTACGSVLFPQYFCSRAQIDTYNGRIQESVNQIVTDLNLQGCSDLEKEKRIHDYLCLHVSYDTAALQASEASSLVAAHSILGVFEERRAVCEGIAKATKLLFNTVNVGCIVVSGKAAFYQRSDHAWNIVKISGQPYQLDVTWDLTSTKNGYINYDYFNLTDKAIAADHFDFAGVPRCAGTDAEYFTMNRLYFTKLSQLEVFLKKGVKKDQRMFYFKIADEGHKMSDLIIAARDIVLKEAGSRNLMAKVSASYNEMQRTGRIVIEPV